MKGHLTALLFLFFSPLVIIAQTSTGEVNGTIRDPNGSAVPGAAVKLINEATKIETQAIANDSGYFTFVNLKPGKYTLGIEVPGFKRLQTAPFDVGVSETVTQNHSYRCLWESRPERLPRESCLQYRPIVV